MNNKSRALTGITGAYFVAAELSRQECIATLTSRNTEGIDILASNIDGSKMVSIQVKTSAANNRNSFVRSWHMSKKLENVMSKSLFYVFVDLNGGNKKPDYYIVPSKVVADYIRITHQEWLKKPSKTGKQHVDTDMRFFEIYDDKEAEKYHNKWKNLGLR